MKDFKPTQEQLDRFWSRVTEKVDGCWTWDKPNNRGYGVFSFHQKNYLASRFSVMIKEGRFLGEDELCCHTCDNRLCVNPSHLYIGDQKSNMKDMRDRGRAVWQNQKHCKHGHEYTKENTLIRTDYLGRKFRRCKICQESSDRQVLVKRITLEVLTSHPAVRELREAAEQASMFHSEIYKEELSEALAKFDAAIEEMKK